MSENGSPVGKLNKTDATPLKQTGVAAVSGASLVAFLAAVGALPEVVTRPEALPFVTGVASWLLHLGKRLLTKYGI